MSDIELESIVLHRFLGFRLSKIEHFEASFVNNKLQILNSTNGGGKSTAMSEMSMLPINKELFFLDGYKIAVFKSKGKRYRMYSDHKRNSLIDLETDTELCGGGTQTHLLQVLEARFNITPLIWAICMGNIKFTDCDRKQRAKWIETISGVNFDYSFQIQKKLNAELNGSRNALKQLNNQLVTESVKLLSKEEIATLLEVKEQLTNSVRGFLLARNSNIDVKAKDTLVNLITDLERKSKLAKTKYKRVRAFSNKFEHLTSTNMLKEHYGTLQAQIRANKERCELMVDSLAKQQGLLSRIQSANNINIDDLVKRKAEINTLIEANLKYKEKFHLANRLTNVDDNEALLNKMHSFINEFISMMVTRHNAKSDCIEFTIKEEVYNKAKQTFIFSKEQLNILNARREDLIASINEHSGDASISCPKCEHSFLQHELAINKLKDSLKVTNDDIERFSADYEKVKLIVETYEEVVSKREIVVNYLNTYFANNPYYCNYLVNRFNDIDNLITVIDTVKLDSKLLFKSNESIKLSTELDYINKQIEDYDTINKVANIDSVEEDIYKGELEVNNLRQNRVLLEKELNDLIKVGKEHKEYISALNDLIESAIALKDARIKLIKVKESELIDNITVELQNKLAIATKKVNDNEILIELIARLESMVESLKVKVNDLKVLEVNLTNLIAQQLTGYVEAFANQVTSVIEKLWGYPMQILPCKIDAKKGMDYQFPILVGDTATSDIKKGSTSMVSVINLSIMMCTRIGLGMNTLPLFLDEVGGGFDSVHDEKLVDFIRDILDNYPCSNLFLVHHNPIIRKSLGVCDTIVFDDSQVDVEPGYNAHVKIKRSV